MVFEFMSIESLALLNVVLSIITFGSLIYARKQFFPGMFRNMLDLLVVAVLFVVLNETIKLLVAFSAAQQDAVFEITLIFPMVVNVILLLIAHRAVKMAEVYGFAGNPPVFKKARSKK